MKKPIIRNTLIILMVSMFIIVMFWWIITLIGDASSSCLEYYAAMKNPPAGASLWCESGEYFSWKSTLSVNADFAALSIFHACQGDPDNPAILMIHGYPTSSFDYAPLFPALSDDYHICALDTPGYGFSDKPMGGFDYSIFDDAQLIDYYIREIAALDDFALLTHDKGDSVGLALLQIYQAYDEAPYQITHHFITNGNIFLPLAQLTSGQKVLLNPVSGPVVSNLLPADQFARGIGESTFATTLTQSEIQAYASIFGYQDGISVQHEIIEYLNERKANEVAWLETLGRSDIPTTIIWGELDQIAPLAVADHVWMNYLRERETPATYWRIPCADHYLQVDTSDLMANILRTTIAEDVIPAEIEGKVCTAIKIQ
jgi:pimeloyl-ACP methyl ester carboxylesterase